MAKALQLPTELWLDIARYLPKSQHLQLKSLNAFFFHCAMDIEWGQIAIDMRIPDQTHLVLTRMADPFVASRTRRLNVCLRDRSTSHMPSSRYKVPSILSYTPIRRRELTPLEYAAVMTQLFNVLPLLNNLTFLKLELFFIPHDFIQKLFRAITTSPFTRNIEKLSLTGHSDVLAPLAECPNPKATFANLSALDLILIDYDNDDALRRGSDTNKILSLARFILSLSLQHLSIDSSYDVTPLFTRLTQPLHDSCSLTPLPNLRSVVLTPLNYNFPYSPQSIHQFLLIHSVNIQHLQLNLVFGTWPLQDMGKVLEKWLSDFVNDNGYDPNDDSPTALPLFFPNLQTLDIHPPDTPAGLSAALVFVERTAHTLSSLRIQCTLSIEGAEQVVSTLTKSKVTPNKLKSLQLNMSDLKVSFIEFLARKLPQLQKLYLRSHRIRFTETSKKLLEDRRRLYMSAEDDCLASWKLRHLSIVGFSIEEMAALAAFIPSVALGNEDESENKDGWY